LSQRRPLPNWFPLLLLCLTIIVLFHRLLLGDVLFWGLPSLQFYPWRDFAMGELAQGHLPLWNPYNGAGAPLLANYQSALLYPPHLLYLVWSGPQMMGWLGMLHLAWAGLGMWLLTGRLQMPLLGRGIATLAYPLSNTLVARFGTIPMLDVAAWLPWLILTVDALITRVTLARVLALAGVAAMQLLAGHAQWTFYSFVLAGGYALWRVLTSPQKTLTPDPSPSGRGEGRTRGLSPLFARTVVQIIIAAIIALALAIGLSAAQLLPTAELQRESQRASGVDEAYALNFSYAPLSLITLFNPDFFGNPGNGTYAIGGVYFETAAYIGILPVVLAILVTGHYALAWRKRHKSNPPAILSIPHANLIPFFALVTILAIVLAFGRFFIYPLLYRYAPTFKLFQAPSRWLLLAVFALSLLAGFATHVWKVDRRTQSRVRLALAGAISIMLAGFAARLLVPSGSALVTQMTQGIGVIGVLLTVTAAIFVTQPTNERYESRWMLAVLIFVAVDLWRANALSNPTVPASFYDKRPPVTTARVLWPDPKNAALPDVAFDRYLSLNNYRVAAANQQEYRQSNLPNLNLLDRQPSLNSFEPLRPDGFERFTKLLNSSPKPALYNAGAVGKVYDSSAPESSAPRVWIAPAVISVNSMDDAEKIMSDDWDAYRTAVIEGANSINGTNSGTANITQESPFALTIAVDTPADSALVVADTYYPGWQATIDGTPATIYRANLAFRAVIVLAGKHEVRMMYQPQSFTVGALFSLVSLALYGVLVGVLLVNKRRSAGFKLAPTTRPL